MADTRTFPDVEFVNKSAEEIMTELVSSWETQMGRSLGMADPIRLMLAWEASIDAQLYAAINESARLNMPRYAFGDYLDSAAEIFYQGLERMEASAANVTMRFTISQASAEDTVIPAGTRCTRDGNLYFETTETAYITAGETYTDVNAVCSDAGTIGNGYEVGRINVCMDPDNVENLQSVSNTTISAGGSARETDAAFYERMRESMGAYSTAGALESYVYHAKSASAAVGAVKVRSPSAGQVDVYILNADGTQPGTQLITTVQNYLSDATRRPLTDQVTVKAPTAVRFDIAATWYLEAGAGISRAQAEANLESALQEYLTWQTTEIGRDINPSRLTVELMNAGIKRVNLTAPIYQAVSEYAVAEVGDITLTYGGEEDA